MGTSVEGNDLWFVNKNHIGQAVTRSDVNSCVAEVAAALHSHPNSFARAFADLVTRFEAPPGLAGYGGAEFLRPPVVHTSLAAHAKQPRVASTPSERGCGLPAGPHAHVAEDFSWAWLAALAPLQPPLPATLVATPCLREGSGEAATEGQLQEPACDPDAFRLGDQGHPVTCTPCAFFHYSVNGCDRSASCSFCHLGHPKRARRGGGKKKAGRAAKGEERAVGAK